MAAPVRFLSGRQQQQKIGIEGSTQNEKVLEVVGRAGIGTTIFEPNVELEVRGDILVSGILTVGSITIGSGGGGTFEVENLDVSGVSTFTGAADFNSDVDIDGHTELDDVNISGVSTFAGAIDANGDLDVDGHTELDDVNISGVSTFAGAIDANGDLDVDGNANITGVVTATTFVGNLTGTDGNTTVVGGLGVSGVSTFTSAIDANGDLDVTGHTELDDVNVSGAITATTFTGDLTGNAGTATALETARTFEVTGDVVASAISFDGTGNVSLAATIQPNSVELGTDTTGDYVQTVSGTANEIVVTGGTGEGSTPTIGFVANPTIGGNVNIGQDLTVTRDLQVTRNVNISGVTTASNTTIGFGNTEFIVDGDARITGVITANRIYSEVFGEFTGSSVVSNNLVGAALSISGISTLGTVQISSGIVTATSGVVTYYGDGSNLVDLTGASAGTYGDADSTAVIQVDSDGRITGITTVVISGSGAIASLLEDTTPQLGGDLDLNGNDITGTGNINITGVVTATSFHTGAEGSAIRVTSNTISGPAEMFIDPSAVGDNTGSVRIKGDLFVDGTQTQINSTTLEIADFVVGIATTATTDSLTDGAGIQIGPDNTFLYEYNAGTNPSLKSSENLNVASGKGYQIDQTEVLNATTLGSGVVNSSLTSVGTLTELSVSGVSTFNDNTKHLDGKYANFGTDSDLQIVHDGTNAVIQNATGQFFIDNNSSGGDIFLIG